MYIYQNIYMYICMCVCVCVYIHTSKYSCGAPQVSPNNLHKDPKEK